MTMKELAKEIDEIKNNHLLHLKQDMEKMETKLEKMDTRLWAILIVLVSATVIGYLK